jgi:hypothetical protein
VAINGATGMLYVFSIDQSRTELSYVVAPLSNLQQLAVNPLTVIIESPGQNFRNNFSPRFEGSGTSGMLVLIDNLSDGTIWHKRLP